MQRAPTSLTLDVLLVAGLASGDFFTAGGVSVEGLFFLLLDVSWWES